MRRIRESKNEPMIYVASLADYNNGSLEGTWLTLTDYDSGAEVLEAISKFLKDLSKEKADGLNREEHAIHDAENIPNSLYSEYMGESTFDQIIAYSKISDNMGIPSDVIGDYVSEYVSHVEKMDASEIEDAISDAYVGSGGNVKEAYENYIDEIGGLDQFESWVYMDCLEMSDTDKRVFLSDEEDSIRDSFEGVYRDEDELEQAVEDRLDEIRDQLDRDAVEYFVDNGYYSDVGELAKETFKNRTPFYVDMDQVVRNLEMSGDFVDFKSKEDGDVYIFRTA